MDLTKANTKREIGRGLFLFIFWMIVQAVVIVFLDLFSMLPSTIGIALGWGGEYLRAHTWHFALDYHSCFCGVIGCSYTAIGCMLLSNYGLNSAKWRKKFLMWYFVYVALTSILAFEIGSYALDIWFAPLLWLLELELYNILYIRYNKRRLEVQC